MGTIHALPVNRSARRAEASIARRTKNDRLRLRPPQATILGYACGCIDADDLCIEDPTGQGKTVIVVALTSMALAHGRFKNVVIATTQNHIEDPFVDRWYNTIYWPETTGYGAGVLHIPEAFLRRAREQGSKIGEVIEDYVGCPRAQDHAIVCTHASLHHVANWPEDLSGTLFIFDEAHYTAAKELRKIVATLRERGARIVLVTATAYHNSGEPVVLDNMRVLRRSQAEAMKTGYAPKNLVTGVIPILSKDTITVARFRGDEAPTSANVIPRIAKTMVECWKSDGRPVLIIHVPAQAGGTRRFIKGIEKEFCRAGARVYDASGVGEGRQEEFLNKLKAERSLSYADRTVDVWIGCQRVHTGTDIPTCSAVYMYGLTASAVKAVQLIGRAMRPKDADHPSKDRSIARFFVEVPDVEMVDFLNTTDTRNAITLCCLLGDYDSPGVWEIERAIIDTIDHSPHVDEQQRVELRADMNGQPLTTAKEKAEMMVDTASVMTGPGPTTVGTLKNVLERRTAERSRSDVTDEPQMIDIDKVYRFVVEQIADTSVDHAKRVRAQLQKEVDRSIADGWPVDQAIRRAFGSVLAAFNNMTLREGPRLASFKTHMGQVMRIQQHELTGDAMMTIAQRVLGKSPLTEAIIRERGEAFKAEFGEYPNSQSGNLHLPPNEDWKAWEAALRNGGRGLPGGSSLAKFFGYDKPDYTEADTVEWMRTHHAITGQWPGQWTTNRAGLPTHVPSWAAIDLGLAKALRGLPGGSSLYILRVRHGLVTASERRTKLYKTTAKRNPS